MCRDPWHSRERVNISLGFGEEWGWFLWGFLVYVAVLRHHTIFSLLYHRIHHSSWMKTVKPSAEVACPLWSFLEQTSEPASGNWGPPGWTPAGVEKMFRNCFRGVAINPSYEGTCVQMNLQRLKKKKRVQKSWVWNCESWNPCRRILRETHQIRDDRTVMNKINQRTVLHLSSDIGGRVMAVWCCSYTQALYSAECLFPGPMLGILRRIKYNLCP